jgi:hypothetical protein
MVMSRMNKTCPPGVFCITPGILVLVSILIIAVAFVASQQYQFQMPSLYQQPQQQQQQQQQLPIHVTVASSGGGGDDRYSRPPRPQRYWDNGPEFPPRGALMASDGRYILNEPTRGLPEAYQSMGVLKTDDGQLLPLFGRRTASRTDRYNYYTRTDTNNPVPLPISYKRKDCQDDIGCDELMSGDQIKIQPTGQFANATLYKFDGPMYVPGLL